MKQLVWITPLALLFAACAPVKHDNTISEWQREGLLPPTGGTTSRVYPESASYPLPALNIVVQSNDNRTTSGDIAVADAIRRQVEYDRGLAPSLEHVTIVVENGRIILRGTVKSDLDARVIVDDLRGLSGINDVSDQLEIDPDV
jgi:hypothetical protein